MKKACLAVLEHLFGNYTYCDIIWCKFLQVEGDEEKISKSFQWEKEKDDKLCNQLKTIKELYMSEKALQEINHKYNTNKSKFFNKLVTKFVPKTSYLCSTIAGKSCVYVAAGIESIGYVTYYSMLCHLLGIEYTKCLFNLHAELDKNRNYRSVYF